VLTIRLRRTGARHAPSYRLVVSESTLTPRGSFVDNLGTYDPATDPASVRIDLARADDWMRKGAQPSATVRSLLGKVRRRGA